MDYQSQQRYCTNCGQPLAPGAGFCNACGFTTARYGQSASSSSFYAAIAKSILISGSQPGDAASSTACDTPPFKATRLWLSRAAPCGTCWPFYRRCTDLWQAAPHLHLCCRRNSRTLLAAPTYRHAPHQGRTRSFRGDGRGRLHRRLPGCAFWWIAWWKVGTGGCGVMGWGPRACPWDVVVGKTCVSAASQANARAIVPKMPASPRAQKKPEPFAAQRRKTRLTPSPEPESRPQSGSAVPQAPVVEYPSCAGTACALTPSLHPACEKVAPSSARARGNFAEWPVTLANH